MLTAIAIANYRSLRNLVVPLGRLTVVTGANGSGKSSLYRGLRLLAETAQGGLVASLAREGGLESTLWAGPEAVSRSVKQGIHPVQGTRRTKTVSLGLGFAAEDFGYAIDLGLPPPPDGPPSAFQLDPEIKRECVWSGPVLRPGTLLVDRRGPSLRVKADENAWQTVPAPLSPFESMMTAFADPRGAPEMILVRERLRSWRFYDHFRSDAAAPARQPQVGTHTPKLSHDGADLAAALQTIREIGDAHGLAEAVSDAFPGAALEIHRADGRFDVAMRQHGLLRPLRGAELSDGTLRYLLLLAALLTPRPPDLMVLNEPETSLHPDLIPALGRLITTAAGRSQILVVTHARDLADRLGKADDGLRLQLEKTLGETTVAGLGPLERPRWEWPAR